MSQSNTISSFGALLKEYYTDDAVRDASYEDNPLFAMMPKNEMVTGKHYNVPVIYGQGQGRSASFVNAQQNGTVSGTSSAVFQVALLDNWADATISSDLILSSGNDRGAFMKAATQVTDGQLKNLAVDTELSLFGDGTGLRGTVAASATGLTSATGVITFANPKSALNFEVGMLVVSAATATSTVDNSGTSCIGVVTAGATGGAIVGKVDRLNGTITIVNTSGTQVAPNDASYGLPSIAGGRLLYALGDQTPGVTVSSSAKLLGLAAWLPYGGPASNDSFTSSAVNRSLDPVRLAGCWFNGVGLSTEEALIKSAALVSEQGDKVTHDFMNYPKFAAFASGLSSKVQIVDFRATPEVGFQSIDIMGPAGPIKVVPARSCPATNIFGLKLSEWELVSVRKAIFVWDLDGRPSLRQGSDSGVEMRFMSYSNAVCHKPSAQVNVSVQSA